MKGSTNKEAFVYPLMYAGYQQELAKQKLQFQKFEQLFSIELEVITTMLIVRFFFIKLSIQ